MVGAWHRTPDLAAIVQEQIRQTGRAPANYQYAEKRPAAPFVAVASLGEAAAWILGEV